MTLLFLLLAGIADPAADLESARDRQDRPALTKAAAALAAAAGKEPDNASGHYRTALAQSYLAEVAIEQRDRGQAKAAAEEGIRAVERAIALKPDQAEYHRLLGTLCGQVIPANVLAGLKYGRCAQDAIAKAVQLDPKAAVNYVSRGVGNYYLPAAFGGGVEPAIRDFEKAIQLNPRLAEAHLWLGIALRKAGRNADARKALAKAVELNPRRVWAKEQLDKTPAQ